jgi:hypothetical protein
MVLLGGAIVSAQPRTVYLLLLEKLFLLFSLQLRRWLNYQQSLCQSNILHFVKILIERFHSEFLEVRADAIP